MTSQEFEQARVNFDENRSFFSRAAGLASILVYLQREGLIPEDFKDKSVVELGCGDGSGLLVFKLMGADISGADLQKYGHINSWIKNPLIDDIPFFVGTSYDFLRSLPDSSLNAVFAFNVESDVWTKEVSEEVVRVLKQDGTAVVSWQDINFSSPNGIWPEYWPEWPYEKKVRKIYDPALGPERGHKIVDSVNPRSLAEGRVIIDSSVSPHSLTMPDVFVMVGKKV